MFQSTEQKSKIRKEKKEKRKEHIIYKRNIMSAMQK
jgi:hypothetical protein